MRRLLESYTVNDLSKKMVFLTGPRQVGKTWLATDDRPDLMVEAKLSDPTPAGSLVNYHSRYNIPGVQAEPAWSRFRASCMTD